MPGPDAADEQLLVARDALSFELFYVRHVDVCASRARGARYAGHQTGQVEVPDPGTVGLVRVGRELWIGHPDGRITVVR